MKTGSFHSFFLLHIESMPYSSLTNPLKKNATENSMLKPPHPLTARIEISKGKKNNKEFIWQEGSRQHAEPSSPSRNYTGSGKHSLYLVPFRARNRILAKHPGKVLAMVGIRGVRLFKEIRSSGDMLTPERPSTRVRGRRRPPFLCFAFEPDIAC